MSIVSAAMADATQPIAAHLTIHADEPGAVINRHIYGQFSEHLGSGIYGGIWVGEESSIPNTRGIRNDVVAALRNIAVPVVRWPGGCFADEYHWRDGIGPRNQRPRTINSNWGKVVETNQFGTAEYMDFCEQVGCDPYITANVGSGSVQEMMDWIEYITSDSDSTLADLRRANGRDKPWKLPYVAIGNESWGCGGDMRPEYYSDNFRRYHAFLKNLSGNHIFAVACGPGGADYHWTDVVMNLIGLRMDGLSLHYYSLPSGKWNHKGSATDFGEDEWFSTLRETLKMEELIRNHSAIMDKYDPHKHVGLIVDEWGTWYDAAPGTNPGFLVQQNTLRDAIVAGINLNIFNDHCDRVVMANIAQMINVLQAMILTDGPKMILTPTYDVFEMYKVHQDATLIPTEVSAPPYALEDLDIPRLSVSASRDLSGKLHVSIVNLDPDQSADVTTDISGFKADHVSGSILTAAAMNAHNTFDDPDAVHPVDFTGFETKPDGLLLHLPAKSVVMLEISQ